MALPNAGIVRQQRRIPLGGWCTGMKPAPHDKHDAGRVEQFRVGMSCRPNRPKTPALSFTPIEISPQSLGAKNVLAAACGIAGEDAKTLRRDLRWTGAWYNCAILAREPDYNTAN
jgi:hypothetical protein